MRTFETRISEVRGEWPGPPARWHYSALRDIEVCPRRWALSNATYPGLWSGRGYPRRPSPAALVGRVIHRSVESIIRSLTRAGCTGLEDPTSAVVLRDLGGISEIVDSQVEAELHDLQVNPRAARMSDSLKRYLTEHAPSMRTAVQQLVRNVERISPRRQRAFPGTAQPTRLSPGTYPEQVVEDEALSFMGVIDLLEVTEDGAEIAEFKSGSPDPTHEEQVRCYSAVWRYDATRNPDGWPATRLRIAYPSGSIDVAPDRVDDDHTRNELRVRISIATEALEQDVPDARPTPENCRFCSVRHLCDEYWESGTNEATANAVDLELVVQELRTASSATVLLPGMSSSVTLLGSFDGVGPGDRLRALELFKSVNKDTGEIRLRVGPQSELFVKNSW